MLNSLVCHRVSARDYSKQLEGYKFQLGGVSVSSNNVAIEKERERERGDASRSWRVRGRPTPESSLREPLLGEGVGGDYVCYVMKGRSR